MNRQAVIWTVLAILLALFLYGIWSARLFGQQVWAHEGLVRLACFAASSAAWFAAFTIFRPGWLVRATLAAALVGVIAIAGIQAPLAVLLLFASAWALGSMFAIEGVLAMIVGLCLYCWLIGFAVHWPLNYGAVYAAAFAVPLACRGKRLLSALRETGGWLSRAESPERRGLWATVLCGFILLMHLAVVLGPEVSADGLAMHLAIPAAMRAHHQWIFDVRETTWAVLPMAGDWAFTAAYMLAGEAAARLFNFGMLLTAAFLVYSLSRRLLPPPLSLFSAALFVSSPMVQLVTGSLFVENFWAVMLLGSAASLVRYAESGRMRYASAAAIALGTALAAKFGTLAYLAPVLVLLGLEMLRRRALRQFIAVAALLLLFGLPPYLGALMRTGNPVYPFLNHIFRSPYFESGTPFVDSRFPPPPALRALFDLTFLTARHFEGQNAGWTFLCFLFLPLAILLLRPRRAGPAWTALAILAPASVLTLASQGNVRYLYPAIPFCAVAAAGVLAELKETSAACYRVVLAASAAVVVLHIWFMPASGSYHKQFWVNGNRQAESYLAASAPVRKVVSWLNQAHPGEPAVFLETNQIAGLQGRALTATWHNAAFQEKITAAGSARQCLELIQKRGIRLIVAPAGTSSIVHVALRRMVANLTRPVFSHAGWQVRTPLDSQPADSPRAVLTRGAYDDMDLRIEYSGRWDSARFSEAANGSVTYSNGPGDWFRVWFEGDSITWVYTRASNRGSAVVSIDGDVVGAIDLHSPDTLWRARSRFTARGTGSHVLVVRALATRTRPAAASFIDLDEIVIE